MKRQSGLLIAGILVASLAGCLDTSNPITGGVTVDPGTTDNGGGGTGGGGTTATTSAIPGSLAVNLDAVVYNAGAGTLKIKLTGLDSPDLVGTMTREPTLDLVQVNGAPAYQAYSIQETSLNRRYLAYFAQGDYVMAGAVATEYQFASYFGGTTYDRSSDFIQPSSGSARYLGRYAGIINYSPNNYTDRGTLVTGDAFVSVNFAEALLEGAVINRVPIDTVDGTGQVSAAFDASNGGLPDLALKVTDLENGNFFGDVIIGDQDKGDYGGVIGGPNAEEVAIVLVFAPYNDPFVEEYGAMVLPECGSAHASPLCP